MKKTNPAERELNGISLSQVSNVAIIWPDSYFITWDLTYKINIIHSYFIHTQTPAGTSEEKWTNFSKSFVVI